jgi:acetyl-CoA C-acetyltransferase
VAEAYVVAAVRTPIGIRKGALAQHHPADLAAHILRELIERAGVDPAVVDDVIMGCVNAMGPQAACIARTAWLSAGLPESVPGVTIDRQCGSSQTSGALCCPGRSVRYARAGRGSWCGEHGPCAAHSGFLRNR